jgi:sRNA-binding protein
VSDTKERRKSSISRDERDEILIFLKEKYAVFQKAKPLCYTIKDEILAVHLDMTRAKLTAVLGFHTKSFKYLSKMLSKTHRYNLKEEKVSEIKKSEKEWTKNLLSYRKAKSSPQVQRTQNTACLSVKASPQMKEQNG